MCHLLRSLRRITANWFLSPENAPLSFSSTTFDVYFCQALSRAELNSRYSPRSVAFQIYLFQILLSLYRRFIQVYLLWFIASCYSLLEFYLLSRSPPSDSITLAWCTNQFLPPPNTALVALHLPFTLRDEFYLLLQILARFRSTSLMFYLLWGLLLWNCILLVLPLWNCISFERYNHRVLLLLIATVFPQLLTLAAPLASRFYFHPENRGTAWK